MSLSARPAKRICREPTINRLMVELQQAADAVENTPVSDPTVINAGRDDPLSDKYTDPDPLPVRRNGSLLRELSFNYSMQGTDRTGSNRSLADKSAMPYDPLIDGMYEFGLDRYMMFPFLANPSQDLEMDTESPVQSQSSQTGTDSTAALDRPASQKASPATFPAPDHTVNPDEDMDVDDTDFGAEFDEFDELAGPDKAFSDCFDEEEVDELSLGEEPSQMDVEPISDSEDESESDDSDSDSDMSIRDIMQDTPPKATPSSRIISPLPTKPPSFHLTMASSPVAPRTSLRRAAAVPADATDEDDYIPKPTVQKRKAKAVAAKKRRTKAISSSTPRAKAAVTTRSKWAKAHTEPAEVPTSLEASRDASMNDVASTSCPSPSPTHRQPKVESASGPKTSLRASRAASQACSAATSCPSASTTPTQPQVKAASGAKRYTCDVCSKVCTRPGDLRRHLLTHVPSSFECFGCNKIFTRPDARKRHLNSVEGRAKNCKARHNAHPASADAP